jgi:hypothetical protein
VALTLTIGVWSYMGVNAPSVPTESGEVAEFSQAFEQTMLATVTEQAEELW